DPPGHAFEGEVASWKGELILPGGGLLEVSIARLHPEPEWQDFETRTLRERFQKTTGEPWQVSLITSENCTDAVDLMGARVQTGHEVLQSALSQTGAPSTFADPVQVLFRVPERIQPGLRMRFVLWGDEPGEGALFLAGKSSIELTGGRFNHLPGPLAGSKALGALSARDSSEAGKPDSSKVDWAAEKNTIELEVLRLQGELENALEERVQREEQFVAFNELMSSIVPKEASPEILTALGVEPDLQTEPAFDADRLRRQERSKIIFRELRALLVVERLDSLDLLEVGLVGEGFVGPVVFRLLDLRGRPVGSLSADRLRLEGSLYGRSMTIVLEYGCERRDGKRLPFAGALPGQERGGERRIFLASADPSSWIEALPDLFGAVTPLAVHNDGRWEGFLVHRKLNELLQTDAQLGYYRLSALGGVLDNQLRGVELEQLDRSGGLVKRLVADKLTISLETRGVLLLLEDGIQMQGANKFAFLDGRYRIFLPGASQESWRTAGLPGLVASKDSALSTSASR
ncbi:MAG: hypothetical protein ACI9F9_000149, partial [Candidatus Paceibacteria bacterium]